MKIGFCVIKNIDYCGGIEKYTYEVGSRLVKRGHDVTVYCMNNYGSLPHDQAGMRLVGTPCLHVRSLEKISASFTSALAASFSKDLDVVHFHDLAPGSLAGVARLLSSHRCVMQFHGMGWKRSRWGKTGLYAHKVLEKLAIKQSHAYTAVSKVQCDYCLEKYGLDVEYIPTGAEIKAKIPAWDILDMGLEPNGYILFTSRLVREKGAHYLIPAFRRLDTDCKLVLAGEACDESYKKELLALAGNDKRIILPGYVRGRMLEELFSNAQIYVQPSEIEGLSIALLEAMSYRNCCLVSDIPENLEAIGQTGWGFQNKNINSLAEKLAWLLANPQKAQAMSQKACDRVREYFSWDRIAEQFEKLYQRVLYSKAA